MPQPYGLSSQAKNAYKMLLAGQKPEMTDEIRAELAAAGALSATKEHMPVAPSEALYGLLQDQLPDQLSNLRSVLSLAQAYHDLAHVPMVPLSSEPDHRGVPSLEALYEPAVAQQAHLMVMNAPRRKLAVLQGFDTRPNSPILAEESLRAPPEGMRWREIVHISELNTEEKTQAIRDNVERFGYELRVMDNVPLWMVIADDHLAILSIGDSPAAGALLIRVPAMVSMLWSWFEHIWTAAVQVPFGNEAETGSVMNTSAVRLLDLMAAGLTDEAIGRAMGVSTRTVRRRVEQLCTDLNANNRIQLAFKASRAGWRQSRSS